MIQYLLKNANFSGLFRFVSPNFFKVVSPSILLQIISKLKKNQSNVRAWEDLCAHYSQEMTHAGMRIELKLDAASSNPRVHQKLGASTKEAGENVLVLFFHQILTQETWILDLRSEVFHEESTGSNSWSPKPIYCSIEPEFLKGIRSLYKGFYGSDDSLFDQALLDLGLTAAKHSLRNHFGQGDQSSILFQLKTFQSTFTDVFEACGREKIQLQPDFFVLGLMLLGLYENLESLGIPFDARKCFSQALEKANTP